MQARPTCSSLLVVLALAAGCSDDDSKLTPCPSKGLGVTATTNNESCLTALATTPLSAAGQDCLSQFSDFKNYACSEPQLGIDKTKQALFIQANDKSSFVDVYWTLTNASAGQQAKKLNISAYGIAGDKEGFFSAKPEIESDPATKLPILQIASGKAVSLRVQFKPLTVGEHHAAVYVKSDAQNYPIMKLPLCVKVIAAPPAVGDAGVKRDIGTISFDCKDVGTDCTDTVHPGCSTAVK